MSKHSKKFKSPDGDEMWVHSDISKNQPARDEQVDYIELGPRADSQLHPERYEEDQLER